MHAASATKLTAPTGERDDPVLVVAGADPATEPLHDNHRRNHLDPRVEPEADKFDRPGGNTCKRRRRSRSTLWARAIRTECPDQRRPRVRTSGPSLRLVASSNAGSPAQPNVAGRCSVAAASRRACEDRQIGRSGRRDGCPVFTARAERVTRDRCSCARRGRSVDRRLPGARTRRRSPSFGAPRQRVSQPVR
jgi:hypothetical protein